MRWVKRLVVGVVGLAMVLVVAGFEYEYWAGRAAADRFPAPGRVVDVGGHHLHIDCLGSGSPTVVVDAGAGSWSITWTRVQEALAEHTRTCLYDRAGYGWSAAGPEPRDGRRLPDELHRLLEAASEPGPYLLVGHSMGGWIARLYRDRHPDRVAGIALVESAHEEQWDRLPGEVTALLDSFVGRLGTAEVMARLGVVRLMSRGQTMGADVGPALQPTYEAQLRRPSWFATMASESRSARSMAGQVQALPDLDSLPLLVLSAGRSFDAFRGPGVDLPFEEADRVWMELQAELARLSTRSRQRVSPDATHTIQLDDADLVVRELTAFVEGVRSGVWPPEAAVTATGSAPGS